MEIIPEPHPIIPPPEPRAERIFIDAPQAQPVSDCVSMAAYSYALSIRQMMGDKAPPKEELYADGIRQIERMGPRDAVEEMLMSQMLMTHARILFASRYANQQKNLKWSELFHTAADRASNSFRRQMEALGRHRQPRKYRKTSFTTIGTAHINARQILTQAQTEPSAIQPVRDRAIAPAQGDGAAKAETAAVDQAD